MPGNYTITTRASGTILTASIYNADHQNHVDNATPQGVGGYSSNQAQMQTQTDPGGVGSESLATSVAGELERLRFVVARLGGTSFWYTATQVLADSYATLASAATTQMGSTTATLIDISGTTNISAFGNPGTSGQRRLCRITGAGLTLVASGNVICPGNVNLILLQNDYFEIEHLGSGVWFVTRVSRNAGGVVIPATAAQCLAGTDNLQALTAAAFAGNKNLVSNNGWYKFPGGLIVQWGQATVAGSTTGSVGYPISFPGAPFAMWVSGQVGSVNFFGANAISNSTFSISNNDAASKTFYWLAIGN